MKNIVLLSVILVLIVLAQVNVWACGCPGRVKDITKAVTQDFNQASMVFSGNVVASEWIPKIEKNSSGQKIRAETLVLEFAVDSWWKGKIKNEVIWHTSHIRYPDLGIGESGSNCEYGFEVGKKYLVYADSLEGKLKAHVCGGTRRIEDAEKDIKELQKLNLEEKHLQEGSKLTGEDKSFIIKSILEQNPQIKSRVSQESAEGNLVIKLSEKNIDPKLLPKLPQVEFVLLNTNDIKNYKGKSLTYWEFGNFKVNSFGRVTVVFSLINLGRGFFPSKSVGTYEYQKFNNKWVGKKVSSYETN